MHQESTSAQLSLSQEAIDTQRIKQTALMACIECDLVMQAQSPAAGERLVCPRCAYVVARGTGQALEKTLALSIAALISLVCALSFPFLSFELGGQKNTVALTHVVHELSDTGFLSLAVVALAFMILTPLVYLSALIVLVLRAKYGHFDRLSKFLATAISFVYRWTMADVFIVGVMIALVKISETAEIGLGASFWFYIAFSLLFLRISLIVDNDTLWRWASDDD